MDSSSHYNPTYDPWNSSYSPHPPSAPLLPPPPPLPPPPQSHPDSPNFYALSTQSNGQRQDYHHQQYSHHRQDLPPNPAPSSSYYSHHPPPPLQQQNQPPPLQQHQQQQQHPQYIPQQVSYEPQRISQPLSSSIQCTESRDIAQTDWARFNEKKRHDSWTVDASQSRIRVDDGPIGRNYQYDYSRSSRDSSGVGSNRALDGSSRSKDEFRNLGYVRKESGATRIEGNYQDRGQLKSESGRYFRGLDEGNRVLPPSVGYGSEGHGVSVTFSRNMTRSSASHEGTRNQRWDEARNGGRTLHPRRKDDYYHSEIEHYIDRGRREESNELNRTPRKQTQKKSALLRLETPRSYQNSRENDRSRQHNHHNGKRFNSNSYRGKEHLGHSDRGLVEKQRGRTPVDLDVSFKSNVLVAKPVASPANAGIRSGTSVTPRSSKAKRALLSEKNEKASLTEGDGMLRTHLSFEASVSEGYRQSSRQTTASEIEKEPDNPSIQASSDSGGKLNQVRFVDGVVQDSKVRISDTDPEASTHGSEAKIRSNVHAAEKAASYFETLKVEAKDDINGKHDSNIEACSAVADVIDNQSIMKSHEDVLDRTSTGEALISKVMEKDEIMKTKTKINMSPVKVPVSWPTAVDLSGCSEGDIHFAGKPMCSVGSQHCEDEDMDCIPSRNLPMMEVNTGYEVRKPISSSDGSLGYQEKDFQNSSVNASTYFNRDDPVGQVLAKSDVGGIEVDNKMINKNVDFLSPENDSSRGLHMGLVSPATLDNANVSIDLANANKSSSGGLANANSCTVGTLINTVVESPDMSVDSEMESKSPRRCEKSANLSVEIENVSRKKNMETTPLNIAAEMVDYMDSDEGKQMCVNDSSSLTKFTVKGSSNVLPVEKTDGCSHSDESDVAMAVPSEVCMENVSTERLVRVEDLVSKTHHPPEIPSVDQFNGTDSRDLKDCLSEPNVSLSKDLTDCASESLVERGVSQSAATFCDKLPSLSAFITETNPAVGMNGMSGNETVADTESSVQEIQPCTTVCKLFPEDRLECGSSGAIGSVRNLSADKNLEKDPSKVSSCLVSDSSVSPCDISPLVVVNEHIQNKTSIQANYSDSQGAIMHKENDCAESIEVEEKAKPSGGTGGTSKYSTPGTNIIAGSGDSMHSCDSLSSSSRRNFRQIRSEVHVVNANSKDKEKPKPSGGTSKYKTSGTDIVAVRRDSVFPCDSLPSSPRQCRKIRSEIHVASMVDETSKHRTPGTDIIAGSGDSVFPSNETSKGKESQKGDSLLDRLQEQIMTSHEVTQPGSSLAHFDLVVKPNGDPIEKLFDITSNVGSQENDSLNSAQTGICDGEALLSDGKVSGTEIPGDSGVRVSRSYSHADVKFALTHVKDHVVSVPHRDFQSMTSMSSKYEIEKRKKKSNYPTQKSCRSSLPVVSEAKKNANPPIHITKRHTWHRKSDTSPSSFVAAKPLSSTLPTKQIFPKVTAQSSSSYVRKGNSLLRKPPHGSPGVALGMPSSAIQFNNFTVEDKSTGSSSMVDVDNISSLVNNGKILTLEKQSKPPSDSSTSKVSNAIDTSSGKCALSCSMDHLTTGLPESIMDSVTSGEANVPHSGGDIFKTSDTLIQTGYASDCQQKRNPPNLDSLNLKQMVYVKRKANQLVAASDIHGVSINQISPSDGYFKRSKNQLVRNSESFVNQSLSLPDDALDTRSAANMVSERSSSSAFSDSAGMGPYKQSKFSLVWTQNDQQPRKPIAHMRYQKILPQLVPWKRVTYWRRLMNSVSAYRNGSFSNISQKLSMMRKRHTVYTRSTNGYSLRKSKVLSIGGSHLKWSKSIERVSRKANEEATLAVAAFSKKESEKNSDTRTTSRNHLARERVFRFGSLRYKMDSSRRTLLRISDVDLPCAGTSEKGKGVKRPFIPKRLVIGNEEYVRFGNGNQLVRDPKKRIRVLANEKVRWSLHNVRLRLAKKKKYCQFFTRFGKCNKDDGKCPYVHDSSKIAVCTKFLNGLCANANCKLTHKVIPERMPDCSYFLQGLCNNEACPYRHVHVNPTAAICDGFLKGYCSDGDECRKKHSYICPVFEATGSCSKGSKCKLHHPKLQSKERKRKRPSEPSQKNARGRYFGSLHNVLSESEPMVFDRCSTDSEVFGMEGLDFIALGNTEYEACDNSDPATEQSISRDSDSPISIYNLIRPVALMQ
ncbi:PREDICTED: uncharacterized protein At1g21580-like isoform X1 [Camelina sativa]|uniref:Uncharacterized protein At1g21580-like isoform X1 n=1 Tax=Camelina sativa TaxID=90675 RepID=A0ABM0VQZ8_CAMSA|nr:PREDICTED: uncharacterized protein At1g21580-like isoform X1 [Camelina sativa]